ncbi:MAG: hypothetical protein ABI467_07525 [Kofleriaceae bacterium]
MSTFEFDSEQDEPIAVLGTAMQNLGLLTLFAGMLALVAQLIGLAAVALYSGTVALLGAVSVIVNIVISWKLVSAGRTLIAIPRTDGNDLPLLMTALRRMAVINALQALGIAAGLLAVIVFTVKVLA